MKTELLKGKRFILSNENWCIENENDDIRCAEVWHEGNGKGWMNGFKIQFNGQLIHSTITFPPMQKRLNELISKWHLETETIEDN